MTELTYYVAASLDGFIAHQDGSYDGFAWDDEFVAAFFADLRQYGTVLMGRKTYEVGLKEGKTSPYPSMRQVVFSRTMRESPDQAVELVTGDLVASVRAIKASADAPIWLCGGAEIATTLFQAGLVDRVIVKLNPVAFGSGIPLFGPELSQTPLELTDTKKFGCGIVTLTYRVVRAKGASNV